MYLDIEIAKNTYQSYQNDDTAEKLCIMSAQICFTLPSTAIYTAAIPGQITQIDYVAKFPSLFNKIMHIIPVMQCKMDIIVEKDNIDGKLPEEKVITNEHIYFYISVLEENIYIFLRGSGRTSSNRVNLYAEISSE